MASRSEVTQVLKDASGGSRAAVDQLLPLVYGELRRMAQSLLKSERPDHTLPATALVHEAYLRLIDQEQVDWQNRAHFFAVAAQAIRRILVDHARARSRKKRGGGQPMLSLDHALTIAENAPSTDMLALDMAMTKLAQQSPGKVKVIELRFFGGLTTAETAAVLGISTSSVERHWEFARTWLYRELQR